MPWSNQGGGWQGGGNRGPWSQGPSGGGNQPPDLEELFKRGQDRFRKALPGKLNSGGLGIIALIVLLVWLFTGIYVVNPGERGVVTRFGKFTVETNEGFNYHWPYPIESVRKVSVTFIRTTTVGYRDASDTQRAPGARDVPEESLMLTGDENILDVGFAVLWKVKSGPDFLFNVKAPEQTIKAMAESAMREVVGRSLTRDPNAPAGVTVASLIEQLQTERRMQTQNEVQRLIQEALDSYSAGVEITQVQLQEVEPPTQVIEAFRDVQSARADKDRLSNEARKYANKVVPEARGEAQRIRKDAEAYRDQTVAQANGEAQRFVAIYDQYKVAKDVTQRRMFLETMERVLARSPKFIIEGEGGSGILPYLPLNELSKRPSGSQGGNQ